MPFFTYALPTVILILGLFLAALPVRADGLSVSSLFGDDDRYGGGGDGFRANPRDSDDWRRRSGSHGASDADRARGVAARELLEAIEDGVNAGSWIPFRQRKTRGQEILATLEQSLSDGSSAAVTPTEQSLRSRFRLHLARGIEYRQDIEVADQPLKMRLYGPIVSGSPGLGFQLRGEVSERDFEVQAFGSTDEVGLEIRFDF